MQANKHDPFGPFRCQLNTIKIFGARAGSNRAENVGIFFQVIFWFGRVFAVLSLFARANAFLFWWSPSFFDP